MNNLNSIFSAILPENLKNTPAIKEYIDIFIEILEENSKVSLDSINFLNENLSDNTKEELVKIYLYDYYSMIKRLKSDYYIVNRFREENKILRPYLYENDSFDATISNSTVVDFFNIGGSIITSSFSGPEFDNVLASEVNINPIYSKLDNLQNAMLRVKPDNFYFNRLFKETKGFVSSIRFIYDCLNKYLVPDDERLQLEIKETGDPFKLLIKGSVDREIYRSGVEYLTHPLGFVYTYDQVRQIKFDDYFSVKYIYKNSKVEVRCLYGNSETYDKQIKEVIKYNGILKVIFTDLTLLTQENGEIKYYSADGVVQKKYPAVNHCSIYLSYDLVYNPTIYDQVKFLITSAHILDNVIVTDKLRQTIIYTPKVGLVIGRFFLGVGERFNKDNNIYSKKITEDFKTSSKRNIKQTDNIIINDKDNFKLTNNLITEELKIKDEENIFSSSIFKDKTNIDDSSKILLKKVIEETYDKEVSQVIKFNMLLSEMDDETIQDVITINGGNEITEEFKYVDQLRDTIRSTFKEIFEVSEKNVILVSNKITDNVTIFDSELKYSQKINIKEQFNKEITDEINSKSSFKNSDSFSLPSFEIYQQTCQFINDSIDIQDDFKIQMSTTFKLGELIGNYTINDNSIITDTDITEYYKYKDTMDIS